ncbi:hypothetical protein EON64_19310 [archaeon]|nr:MAG: hypothetical protein EON64_19310 [archaeon]
MSVFNAMHEEKEVRLGIYILSPEFFFDLDYVFSIKNANLAEIKAHTILLSSRVESFLKAAALIDGSTVDFLFGAKFMQRGGHTRSRSNEVKRFIRNLSHCDQETVCVYYAALYAALVEYYEQRQRVCGSCWESQLRVAARERIDRAFGAMANAFRTGGAMSE